MLADVAHSSGPGGGWLRSRRFAEMVRLVIPSADTNAVVRGLCGRFMQSDACWCDRARVSRCGSLVADFTGPSLSVLVGSPPPLSGIISGFPATGCAIFFIYFRASGRICGSGEIRGLLEVCGPRSIGALLAASVGAVSWAGDEGLDRRSGVPGSRGGCENRKRRSATRDSRRANPGGAIVLRLSRKPGESVVVGIGSAPEMAMAGPGPMPPIPDRDGPPGGGQPRPARMLRLSRRMRCRRPEVGAGRDRAGRAIGRRWDWGVRSSVS